MRSIELFSVDDAALRSAYEEQIAPHTGVSAMSLQMELQRRAAVQLATAIQTVHLSTTELSASSKRLERLTVGLFILTILLLIAGIVPALDVAWKLQREKGTHQTTGQQHVAPDVGK